jgi:hypothetical protein
MICRQDAGSTFNKNGGRLSSPAALINKLWQLDEAYEW